MAFRGRGGGGAGNRQTQELLGLTKEQIQASVEVPIAFPPRNPTSAPPPITDEIQHMLDVGASIKKAIRAKMESGDFHPNLGVPLELLVPQDEPSKLKKKSKKKKRKDVAEHLKKLENEEEEAAKSDDEKPGEQQEEEDSDEDRHDSDDSGSEDEDDEMDEGNDYGKDYYNEEEEDAAPDEDEGYDDLN